jgi:hypothetical protein
VDTKTGLPVDTIEPFNVVDERLEVCAHLEVDYIGLRGYSVPLGFTWLYEDETVQWSNTRMYAPGYITDSFNLKPGEHLRSGVYQVEIHHGRSVLASTQVLVISKK